MTIVNRFIFPVGHGGFAAEAIEDKYLAVIDCGSDSCPTRVSMYIDEIKKRGFNCVDRLFITHFDNDHVKCIKKLIDTVGVKEVVVPFIPHDMRYVYNIFTKGAYLELLGLFNNHENRISRENNQGNEIELSEINEEKSFSPISTYDIWEWNVKCQLTKIEWNNLRNEFISKNIDIKNKDSNYLVANRKEINKCFKTSFGVTGPNCKGLIVLSQRCKNVQLDNCIIKQGITQLQPTTNTGCLYTGDAQLKKNAQVESFVNTYLSDSKILLTQIPHHGSRTNSDDNFAKSYGSDYYFYHDKDSTRIKKNKLYTLLQPSQPSQPSILLDVRDCCKDLIWNCIELK